LKKIGPGKAKVLKNLVQTQLKFEENWSRQSLSLKKIGPGKAKVGGKLVQAKFKF
jgi:hypothetical protein